MLKEEAAAVSHASAFGPSNAMNTLYEQNVLNDVLFCNELHLQLMMVLKKQPHFHQVSPDGSLPIITYLQGMMQLIEPVELIFA